MFPVTLDENKFIDYKSQLVAYMQSALEKVAAEYKQVIFVVERPKHFSHGDYSCNLALQLARITKKNPRQLAEALLAALPPIEFIDNIALAGAAFINFTLTEFARQQIIRSILEQKQCFGRTLLANPPRIQLEFVSANPTGPLHIGHGRSAAYGASLANVLRYAGADVSCEYYINDAGRQMDILALSTWLRYVELHKKLEIAFPSHAYQGEYIIEMARVLLKQYGSRFLYAINQPQLDIFNHENEPDIYLDRLIAQAKQLLGNDYQLIHQFVSDVQVNDIKNDLTEFGVIFNNWFSEQLLYQTGEVAKTIQELAQKGYIYELDGAKWFCSTRFGDEKDRVVQRENGIYTYFAADIAYLKNKFSRGFTQLIYIYGADHHGYTQRLLGAAQALGFNPANIQFFLVQFAVLYKDGQKISMSTRSGEFIPLRELRNDIGNDVTRFFYITKKSDQHLDFNVDLAKSQSHENPVYYIQYAHARICRIWDEAAKLTEQLHTVDLSVLTLPHEIELLRILADFPEVINKAAQEYAPHIIAFYLKDIASSFHSYYNMTRILVKELALTKARLALVASIRQILANGLALLGVSAPYKM